MNNEEKREKINYLYKKWEEILEKIKPICEVFSIECDYAIGRYGDFSETLILNGQEICCSMNSIGAVEEEVIGYIFVRYYGRWWYHKPQALKFIKQYWKE